MPHTQECFKILLKGYLSKSDLFLPGEVELSIAENIVHKRHVRPHICFLTGVQRRSEGNTLRIDKGDNRVHLGHDEGASSDEGDLAAGGHVLCIASHLDGEVQGSHVEEGLHCQARGVVWQKDLLNLQSIDSLLLIS